ncbi:MAG: DoxX family protein [Xanthobacteraceae bacterium]|jgi:putative oxidoreductase
MDSLKYVLAPLGRLLMSSLFIWAGIGKLMNPGGTAQYFASVHVPAPEVAVWVVVIFEIVVGLAILVGFKTRWAAALLAIFCLITALGVHLPAGDLANMTAFYKNLVMAGGFFYVVAYGAGAISIDGPAA